MLSLLAAASLTIGAGKMINNTSTGAPGWMGSIRATLPINELWGADIGYTRLGNSWLAQDAGITTLGLQRHTGRYTLGVSAVYLAAYSPKVWWYSDDPNSPVHCSNDSHPSPCRNYPHGGNVKGGSGYMRHCHLCGGVLSVQYALTDHIGIRAEYYGLRHIEPTFQGVVIQITYTIGGM
jgi:hypothetical protein